MLIRLAGLGIAAVFASTLSAQAAPLPARAPVDTLEYVPSTQLPSGRQLVVIYIGATGCGFSRDTDLKAAVRRMKPLLARQSDALKRPLTISGVALDWAADSGLAYLQSLGAWDEISAGSSWTNSAAVQYIWRENDGRADTPQVVVYERDVASGDSKITFGPDRRIARFVGVDEIVAWVRRGAPITSDSVPAPTAKRRPLAG